jgi:environmental stress-induced protein Ves
MSIVRANDLRVVPWKNGLGSTRELAVHPAGANVDTFDWRVSIAEVSDAAPFSSFPGVDRTIVLLQGDGFTMTLDGSDNHALTTPFAPFAFPGEARVDVALAGGATQDFNLMVRRERARGSVEAWHRAGERRLESDMALLYCAGGTITIDGDELQAGDSWLRTPDTIGKAHVREGATVLVVRIEPRI